MSKAADEEHAYYQVLRVMIVAFMKGTAPSMARGNRPTSDSGHVRPSFQNAEKRLIGEKGDVPAS